MKFHKSLKIFNPECVLMETWTQNEGTLTEESFDFTWILKTEEEDDDDKLIPKIASDGCGQ